VGRLIFSRTDLTVCVSEYEKSLVMRDFRVPEMKTVVISNGVDLESFHRALAFEKDGKVLLVVGRLEAYKNVHLAVRLVRELPVEYSLVVIGDGPCRDELRFLAERLGVAHRVRLINGASRADLLRWYKTCDLVLNFSEQEAFGITVLEGLAAGKPVLVNNRAGLAELALRFKAVSSLDVHRTSVRDIASRVQKIVSGYNFPVNLRDYTWDEAVEQYIETYTRILQA